MDYLAIGAALATARIARRWRQIDVAQRARTSQPFVSKLERGQLQKVRVGDLERVASVLEVRLELRAWWRGGELDRLRAGHHSAMHEIVTSLLLELGWEVASEVSFNIYGERGVIDILAWHAMTRTLLIIELKTDLVDVNKLLETTGRRQRLARAIARDRGWVPDKVGSWVVLAESRTNRRRLAAHRILIRTAFPQDGRMIAGWLRKPSSTLSALSFLTDIPGRSARPGVRIVHRVRRPRSAEKAA